VNNLIAQGSCYAPERYRSLPGTRFIADSGGPWAGSRRKSGRPVIEAPFATICHAASDFDALV